MNDLTKGSVVAVTNTGYDEKKVIEKVPVQDLYLKPDYTFKDLLKDMERISVLEGQVSALVEDNQKLKQAVNYCFDIIEILIEKVADENVATESIRLKISDIIGGK